MSNRPIMKTLRTLFATLGRLARLAGTETSTPSSEIERLWQRIEAVQQ